MKAILKSVLSITVFASASLAHAGVTCTADAGSINGPYYTATAETKEQAYADAYDQALTFVNSAERNPAYIEVSCQ